MTAAAEARLPAVSFGGAIEVTGSGEGGVAVLCRAAGGGVLRPYAA